MSKLYQLGPKYKTKNFEDENIYYIYKDEILI